MKARNKEIKNQSWVIFVHDHPYGDLKPSHNDMSLNRKLI
jgi:DNA repair protein RadC